MVKGQAMPPQSVLDTEASRKSPYMNLILISEVDESTRNDDHDDANLELMALVKTPAESHHGDLSQVRLPSLRRVRADKHDVDRIGKWMTETEMSDYICQR